MDRMQMLKYMQGLAQGISTALAGEGLGGVLLRAKRGPMTLCFQFQLLRPTTANISRALNLTKALRQATGVRNVRVSDGDGGIEVEFPSPDPKPPTATQLAALMRGANVAVGLDKWGDPIYTSFKQQPNLMFVGPPNSGKTTAMKSILLGILKAATKPISFIICAPKAKSWESLAEVRGCVGLVSTPGEIEAKIQEYAHAINNKQRVIGEGTLFVLIDDFQNLLGQCKDLATPLATVVSMGREFGIYTMINTQSAGSTVSSGGPRIEASVTARIIFKGASKQDAARATGSGSEGVEVLSGHSGDGLLMINGTRVDRVATATISEAEIAALPRGGVGVPVKPVAAAPAKTLPQVTEKRLLTEDEVTQVKLALLAHKRRLGSFPSQSAVCQAIYGKRQPAYLQLLKQSLPANVLAAITKAPVGQKTE